MNRSIDLAKKDARPLSLWGRIRVIPDGGKCGSSPRDRGATCTAITATLLFPRPHQAAIYFKYQGYLPIMTGRGEKTTIIDCR
jgi:hypothetical protein